MPTKSSNHSFSHLFSGVDAAVPLLNGTKRKYVNLDNAASTPILKTVQGAVNDCFTYYSSVHRGTGFKSQISTHAYEVARKTVLQFVGTNPEMDVCIFVKNTQRRSIN